MKKFILSFFILLSLFVLPSFALAQSPTQNIDPCAGTNATDLETCKAATLGVGEGLGRIIQFLFVIAVILALGFLVYGGIKWITSGGDKGGVENARNMIIAAIVGLIIVFLAYVILNLVLQFLTGSSIDNIGIPRLPEPSPSQ